MQSSWVRKEKGHIKEGHFYKQLAQNVQLESDLKYKTGVWYGFARLEF